MLLMLLGGLLCFDSRESESEGRERSLLMLIVDTIVRRRTVKECEGTAEYAQAVA
jgi:hypothetical protein